MNNFESKNATDIYMSRLPDFLIVGAAKSGTTSLSNYLSEHPSIEIVSNRLEYFGEYCNPANSHITLEKYLQYFSSIPEGILAGEKSVSYLYSHKAIQEIYDLNPDMKIIMILRDPTERAYSDYWHRKRTGVEALSFEAALSEEKIRITNGARFELHYANYGLYAGRVASYIEKFGKVNVYVIRYEDLTENPESVCRRCFELLGVDNNFTPKQFLVHNKGSKGKDDVVLRTLYLMAQKRAAVKIVRSIVPQKIRKKITRWMTSENVFGQYPKLNKETERKLRAFFADDIEMLESLMGWDLSLWKS